jgi:hypothetical protein
LDPLENRDYRGEIEQGLKLLFGDALVSYELYSERQHAMLLMSNPPQQVGGSLTYRLSVQVNYNVSDHLRGLTITKESINLGEYGPHSVSETQEFGRGKIVMRVEYATGDLDGFLDALKDKTWGKFDREFTKQLEDKLDDSD